jgi:hypothetical protein
MPLGMLFPLSRFAFKNLPAGRVLVLVALGILLAVVDVMPDGAGITGRTRFLFALAIGSAAIVMTMSDRLARPQLMAMGVRLLLVIGALTLSAIGAEYTTRWVFRDVTTSADNAAFFTRRWLRSGARQLNSQGFRGPSFSEAKPAGVYRIAVVGDSFTFGNGVRQGDRFTDLLQAQLPARFEVLNFGEPGANTPEHEKRVAKLVRTINPDFILLQWYVNDMEDDDMTGRPVARPLLPRLHDWLSPRSALYTIANAKWGETQVRLGWTRSYVEFVNDRLLNPHGRHAQEDNRFMEELIGHAEKAGVPIGMVLFPDTARPIDEHYPFAYLHDRVLATCTQHKMTCVDLRQEFAAVKDHRQLWASRFDHHASARANAIAAERILTTFAAKWAASASR